MVNGIGPAPASMFGSLGLEVRDSKNCQLIWKTVNKGKRSRKSVIRNSNGLSNLSIESPVRVGDFSRSDSKKYVETPTWPHLSNESVHVPLKKRQRILLSSSLYEDSNPRSIQRPVIDESGDYSGIVLLAATACNIITEELDNVKDGVIESGDSVSCLCQNVIMQLDDKKCQCFPEASYANKICDNNLCTLIEACKEKEASFNCFQTTNNINDLGHMALEPTDASFKLKVGLRDDNGSFLACTMSENSGQHQMEIFEVSEHENDIQTENEEHFQKAFELPENGIVTVGEGMNRETSNTVLETSRTPSKIEGIVTLDEGLVSDALQESIKSHTYDGSDKLDASENEDRVQLDNSTHNIYELEMDYDSPYEDGELRGSVLYSCVENELEDGEHDFDHESEGRVDDDLNSAHYPGPETSLGIINKELEGDTENIKTEGKKYVPNLVYELYPPMGMKIHDGDNGKRKCPFEKLQSCTKGNASRRFGKDDISRTDRENSPNGHGSRITRFGSPSDKYRKTEGNNKYWDSRHDNRFRSRGMDHRLPRFQNGTEKYQPFSKGLNFHGANTKAVNIQNNRRGKTSENYRGVYDKKPLVVDDAEHMDWRTPRSRWGPPKIRPEACSEKMKGPFRKPKFNDGYYGEDFVSSPGRPFLHAPPNNRFVHKRYGDMFRQDQRLDSNDCVTPVRRSGRFLAVSNRDKFVESHSNGRQDERHRRRYADDVSPNSRCSRFNRDKFVESHSNCRQDERHRRRYADDVSPNSRCFRFKNRDAYGESFISPPPRTRWATNNDSSYVNSPWSHTRSPIGSIRQTGDISGERKSNNYLSQSKRDYGRFSYRFS